MATLALSCYFATRKQCRLTLPSSTSSHHQQIVLFQPRAADPRPNQQAEHFVLLVAIVASAWAARILLVQEIQAAGHQRRLQQEAQASLKGTRSNVLHQLIQVRHKYFSRVNKEDRRAIRDYTGNGYDCVNKALRKGAPTAKEQERIDAILRALTKTKKMMTHVGTVFRGAKLTASMSAELQPGATFCDPAFLSTSAERKVAFGNGGGAILFEIESKSGVDVSKESKNKHEAEVLFRPSTMFMIHAIECGVGGFDRVVKMTELF